MSVALYIRLSKEDERDGPSQSVTNQRAMLEKYAADNDLTIYDTYIDDGFSGCDFDRPDFQRLLTDIESGKVNMVITKDLSRLGRDYILTGHYLERYFPEHGVRYVSLLDGIDTHNNPSSNDFTPFRAIMNDMYARDISRKITSVKRDKQRRGQFIGGKPIYGYQKHPTEKNRIIVDEVAAAIVRRIFSMALSGTSCRQIAATLNENKIPSPSEYAGGTTVGQWSGERISEMLQNETYLGNMVQGRRVKVSYKSKKSLRRKREDWIVVAQTHEAIIDQATFDAVSRLLDSRRHTRNRTYDFSLKGLVFCHECGHPLGIVNRKTSTGSDTLYFVCRTYQRNTRAHHCTAHCVKVDAVTTLVIAKLWEVCANELSPDRLLPIAQNTLRASHQHSDHRNNAQQLQRIHAQIDQIYLDHLNGTIKQTDFERIYRSLCQQRDFLEQESSVVPEHQSNDNTALDLTQQFLEDLPNNREFLAHMIDRIEITSEKQLIIHFRFDNKI